MNCTASKQEFLEIKCDREQDSCGMCCIHHICAHNWRTKEVWRTCDNFTAGNCSFKG
ncbi:hypothetical protein BMS3Bbin15_00316 [archaeon BMS3Bbin15]|nr:hypothetical protein BMS3Bbin15_00316 [archaeon BMS3Bbin15]